MKCIDSKNLLSFLKENILQNAEKMTLDEKISLFNDIKLMLTSISPFKNEPIDCVLWKKNTDIIANEYNPNKVAPPEMQLLKISIDNDGYTQPVVTWNKKDKFEVIDGFHRTRVCKEYTDINKRVHGYLPIVQIKEDREGKSDRVASTIRHNRARGKHGISAMSEIVIELKNRNRSNSWIAKNLGMDEDEINRLCQISGLSNLFSNSDFSKAWDLEIFENLKEEVLNEEDI